MVSFLAASEPVAVVGDSIACGYGVPRSWVDFVEDAARGHASALGAASGNGPSGAWRRIAHPGARLEHLATATTIRSCMGARIVVVAAGLNDLAGVNGPIRSGHEVFETTKDFAERLAAAGPKGSRHVVVCTPNFVDPDEAARSFGVTVDINEVLDLRSRLLSWETLTLDSDPTRSILVIDMWPALEKADEVLLDGIHPTGQGQESIAAWFHARLALELGEVDVDWDYSSTLLFYDNHELLWDEAVQSRFSAALRSSIEDWCDDMLRLPFDENVTIDLALIGRLHGRFMEVVAAIRREGIRARVERTPWWMPDTNPRLRTPGRHMGAFSAFSSGRRPPQTG